MFFHWNFRNCFKNCRMNSLAKLGVREWNYYFWKKNVLGLKTVMRYSVCMLSLFSCVWLFETLWTVARLLYPWDSLGKSTGMGSYALLQGTFWTKRLNPHLSHLLHWQAGSLPWASSYYMPIGTVKIQNTDYTKWGCGAIETFFHFWWSYKITQLFWKTVSSFLQN